MASRQKQQQQRKPQVGRASWSGSLRVGLVTVPVYAYNVVVSDSEIHLNQLHAECNRRIHYQKVCPVHGEVDKDQIISAYEYERGKYIPVEKEELEKLRTDADRSLTIETFIEPDRIDPLYLDGRNYYLAPQKEEGDEAYGVLYRAMADMGRWGIGQVVFSEREQIVLLRPHEDLLVMSMLRYQNEMRDVNPLKFSMPRANDKMVKLAEQLIEGVSEEEFDYGAYEDPYESKLRQLIDAKIEGKEIVAAEPEEAEAEVINLADALAKSIPRPQGRRGKSASKRRKASHHAPTHLRRSS